MKRFMKCFFKIAGYISALAAVAAGVAFIAERIEELKNYGKELKHKPYGVYERFVKRPLDCFFSTGALIVFSPILLVLSIVGYYEMKGNPFFTQKRPGLNEKIFRLIKFRSMSNAKDEKGELLPDTERLNSYGKFLRKTSLDELPELINIAKGDMAVVGPRPLAVQYLPYYNEKEKHRHDVRPGLTGQAQINGRNALVWEERFRYDTDYASHITFANDVKIIIKTILKVFKASDIQVRGTGKIIDFDKYRISQNEEIK